MYQTLRPIFIPYFALINFSSDELSDLLPNISYLTHVPNKLSE